MRLIAQAKNLSITFFALLTLTGCVTATQNAQDTAVETPIECKGTGVGLDSAQTAVTSKAIIDHDATSSLTIPELYERVAKGDNAAQIELGLRYANGTGVPQDGERAVTLFHVAAQQGNPIGLFFLGSAHANGLGVPKDDMQAVINWEAASREGYANAQYWLAFMIANGRGGISANWCAAIPIFEAAAKQDVPDASFMLGIAFHEGKIGQPDYEKAANWYRKATSKVLNQKAQYNLRLLIEGYLVEWQDGDPGKPAPPRPKQDNNDRRLKIIDKSADAVG